MGDFHSATEGQKIKTMDGLNYWWNRFEGLKATLKDFKKKHKLKSVEECIVKLLKDKRQ